MPVLEVRGRESFSYALRVILSRCIIFIAIALIGCSEIPIDPDGSKFREMRNKEIGKSSDWYKDYPKSQSRDGKFEYLVESKRSGCKWAITVNESTGLIVGWHYISDQSLCQLRISQVW
jgi:hypothetical protein